MESTSNSAPAATTHVNRSYSPSLSSSGETERQARVVGLNRRPLNYTGAEGWASRIGYGTLYGAAAGTGAGLLVGTFKGSNIPKWMGSMSINCALVTLCFCGFFCQRLRSLRSSNINRAVGSQELVREIRAAAPDDPVNCVLGGFASGGLLGRIQGGPSRALPCALLFAGVGTGLQFGANQLKEYRLSRHLEASNAELIPKLEVKVMEPEVERENWKFPDWFPIQVLDEQAAAKRKAEKEEEMREIVNRLQKGERS